MCETITATANLPPLEGRLAGPVPRLPPLARSWAKDEPPGKRRRPL